VWFRRDRPTETVAPPAHPLLLAHTGTPDSGTGECVAHVRRQHELDTTLWSEFAAVSGRIRDAWVHGDEDALIHAVRENHRLLSAIGVVPEPVQAWIAGLEAAGGAAKICGAGAVRGRHGGVVWVVGAAARREAKQGPHPILQVEVEPHGARLLR
jgi:mevalonate kinase